MSLVKDLAYKTIDAITLGKGVIRHIGQTEIRFPPKWSRYYEAEYEPETFDFFREHVRSGQTVLDIGGHIGLFAVTTAKLVGPTGTVFTFEPTPFTRSVLQEVVDLNSVSDIVEVRGEAVSSRRGEAVFFDTGEEVSNANSLVRSELSKGEIPITLISVDEFVRERGLEIDCIKIDVEGAELDVMLGSKEIFTAQRPVARLGLHPEFVVKNGQSLEEIWNCIIDYKLDVFFDGAKAKKDWFCSQTDLFDVNLIPSK